MVHVFIIFNVKILIKNSSYVHNDIDQPIIKKKLINKLFHPIDWFGDSLGGGLSLILPIYKPYGFNPKTFKKRKSYWAYLK
jgi:hypothetical protein